MEYCEHCPLSGSGIACVAITAPHPGYCEALARGDRRYEDIVVKRSKGEVLAVEPRPEPVSPPPPKPVEKRRARTASEAVKACPHWSKGGCSCGQNRCALGKYGGKPTMMQCAACLKSGGSRLDKTS